MKRLKNRGFTQIQLLTVIASIAMLTAILIPAINHSRISARQAVDQSNVRNIGLALVIYTNENGEAFPATENALDLAELLANEGDLTDAAIWNSPQGSGNVAFDFREDGVFVRRGRSSDYVVLVSADEQELLTMDRLQGRTPMVFLTGLQEDGTWSKDKSLSPYGNRGGAIIFAGGMSAFAKALGTEDFPFPRGADSMTEATPDGGVFIDSAGAYSFK